MNKPIVFSTLAVSISLAGCTPELREAAATDSGSVQAAGKTDTLQVGARNTPSAEPLAPYSVVTALDAADVFDVAADISEMVFEASYWNLSNGEMRCGALFGGGGLASILTSDQDLSGTLTRGDEIDIRFQSCALANSEEVLDGSVKMVLGDVAGSPGLSGPYSYALDLNFRDLTLRDRFGSFDRMNGKVALEMVSENSIAESVSAMAESVTVASEDGVIVIRDASFNQTESNIMSDVVFSLDATVSTPYRQSMRLNQDVPWRFIDDEDFPFEGAVTVFSENGSVVKARARGAGFINLEVDDTGDGIPEQVRDWAWEEIDNM